MKNGVHFEENKIGFGGIYYFYQGGGRFETAKFRGLSHMAEHLACKGEKRFEKEFIMNAFDYNAMTGDNYICFYCKGLEELMADFSEKYISCRAYVPTREEFEDEKNIIIQEVQSALCDYTLSEAFHRGLFDYSGAIGDISAIKNISYEDFMSFYNDLFAKPSVVVFSGGSKMKKAFNKLSKNIEFESEKKTKVPVKMNKVLDTTKFKVWSKKDTNALLYFMNLKTDVEKSQIIFLIKLLGDGFYSPLIQNIREKDKLCYYVYPGIEFLGKNKILQIWTETSQEEKFTESLFNLLKNFSAHVTKDYYESYCKKACVDIKQVKLTGSLNMITEKYYGKDNSFFNTFDPENPKFSYETMTNLAKKLANRKNWRKISHNLDKIVYTETV